MPDREDRGENRDDGDDDEDGAVDRIGAQDDADAERGLPSRDEVVERAARMHLEHDPDGAAQREDESRKDHGQADTVIAHPEEADGDRSEERREEDEDGKVVRHRRGVP